MDSIADRDGHRYLYLVLDAPEDYRCPFEPGAYTCLLWDTRGDAGREARSTLVRRLIERGCVYLVCGGKGCEFWHDLADEAVGQFQLGGELPPGHFVMTTWHEGEPADEVAEFFVRDAIPPEGEVTRHVVVQIGRAPDTRNDLWTRVRGYALSG